MTIVEWINQILVYKTPWENFDESEQKTFNPFIVNRWLSMDMYFIDVVNFFQKYSMGLLKPKDIYTWYCYALPKGKRFNKYIKGNMEKRYADELIGLICKHYETSKKECVEYIELLKKSELISILELYGKNEKEIKKLLKGKK